MDDEKRSPAHKNANRRLYSRCGRSMIVSHTLEVDDAGLIHRIHFSGRGAGSAASHTRRLRLQRCCAPR